MAKKLPEAIAKRMFTNMYICVKCNARMRVSGEKIKKGGVKCRRCNSSRLRPKAKERRGQKA